VLGTGAILLLAGLGWLLVTYSDHAKDIQLILAYIIGGVWLVIIAMLAISGMGVGQAMLTDRWQGFVNTVPWFLAALMAAAVIIVAFRTRKFDDEKLANPIRWAALTALAAAIISALFTGIASAVPAQWWQHPRTWAVYLVVVLSMLVPAVALIFSVPAAIGAVTQKESREISENDTDDAPPVTAGGSPQPPLSDRTSNANRPDNADLLAETKGASSDEGN